VDTVSIMTTLFILFLVVCAALSLGVLWLAFGWRPTFALVGLMAVMSMAALFMDGK
jgi:hypothetical protein